MSANPLLSQVSVTRTRYAAGSRGSDGRWVEGATTDTTIQCSWQQPTRAQVEILTEGQRQRDPRRVLTTSDLRAASQHDGTSADELTLDGVVYIVQSVAHWRKIRPHYDAVVLRKTEAN